jgi:hypothetical protein
MLRFMIMTFLPHIQVVRTDSERGNLGGFTRHNTL